MSDIIKTYNGAGRTAGFRDSESLNGLLKQLAQLLKPVQKELPYTTPIHPVGCIVGNPRSGTTLFQQWLASLDVFSYPTNFLTRFAYAPHIGALVQKMVFRPELDPHGDFADIQSGNNFESDLGKSTGALACNEFQHFFRNHMPNFDLEWLDDTTLEEVDCKGILQGLASIEAVFGAPFTTKANILQFNISYLAEHMKALFWLHVKREPIYNMQSVLIARKRYYGNQETWLSSKPKEYRWLRDMDVHHQIAGQVFFTDKAIEEGLGTLSEKRWMTVPYESFCHNPQTVYKTLRKKYSTLGCELPADYTGATSFKASNEIRLPAADIDALQAAYDEFSSQ